MFNTRDETRTELINFVDIFEILVIEGGLALRQAAEELIHFRRIANGIKLSHSSFETINSHAT